MSFKGKERMLHVVLFMVAMISIGSASILVKLSMASGTACAFWRLSLSSVFIILTSFISKRSTVVSNLVVDRYTFIMFTVSGFALAFHFVLWMNSLFRILIAVSTTIVVAYPLHLALVEVVFGREYTNKLSIAGLVIGFFGIVILFGEAFLREELDIIGVLESFVASIFAALYFYIGRLVRKRVDLSTYSFYVYSIAALTVLLYSVMIKEDVFKYFLRSWVWFLLLALIPMIGGHTVMNYLLRFYKSSTVSSIALAEPVIASILAALILGETVNPRQLLCLVMVLTGVGLSMASEIGVNSKLSRTM